MNTSVQFKRFSQNPILRPCDARPSRPDFEVTCLLNPGAFRWHGRTGLLLRVAERPVPEKGWISTPTFNRDTGEIDVLRVRLGDQELDAAEDSRVFTYRGRQYLTTLSHLRLAWSDDGSHFTVDDTPTLTGRGPLETFGVEDCRVVEVGGRYLLTYTSVSECGVGVGLSETSDWTTFTDHGMILPPHNKDCAIFPRRVGGEFWCLHRPSGLGLGGNYIWVASSPDLLHWGGHRCVAFTRPGRWDEERIGGGAAPIEADAGWLEVYHGASKSGGYCLGAMLFDRDDPRKLLARSEQPLMRPEAPYELTGFFGKVVFTNGHVVDGDHLTLYYGAADEVICGATASIQAIVRSLRQT